MQTPFQGFTSTTPTAFAHTPTPPSTFTANPMFASSSMIGARPGGMMTSTGFASTTQGVQPTGMVGPMLQGFSAMPQSVGAQPMGTPIGGMQSLAPSGFQTATRPLTSGNPGFGSLGTPGFNSSVTPGFASTPSFGPSITPSYASSITPGFSATPGFGSSAPQPTGFTGMSSAFAVAPQPQGGFTSGFTGMATPQSFTPMMTGGLAIPGVSSQGTTSVKYATTAVRDGTENTTVSSIFAMPALAHQSVEEARFADFKAKASNLQASFAPQSNPMQMGMPGMSSMPGLSAMPTAPTSFTTASQPFMQQPAQQVATSFTKPAVSPMFSQPQGQFSALGAQPTATSLFSQATPSLMTANPANPNGMQQLSQAPSLFAAQPSTLSVPNTPSLFSTSSLGQQTNPLLPQTSTGASNSLFAPSQPALGMPKVGAPSGSLFSTAPGTAPGTTPGTASSSLFQPSGMSSVFGQTPTAPQNSLFGATQPNHLTSPITTTPQPGLSSALSPSLFSPNVSAPADPSQAMTSAYRDTHGLSWLFPNSNIDDLLSQSSQKHSVSTSENSSIIERALKSQRTNVKAPVEHWRERPELKYTVQKRSMNLLDIRTSSPRKAEPHVLTKRESFDKVKFEPFSNRDDTPYLIRNIVSMPKPDYGIIEIDIVAYDPEQINIMMTVPKTTLVSQIIEKATSRLNSVSADQVQLVLRSRVLKGSLSLMQAGVVDRDSLDLVMIEMPKKQLFELAPTEQLPKLTTTGYSLQPSAIELARMTLKQLKNVPNFTIKNHHGKIEFEGVTDVSKLDIDQIVQIEASSVCVYPDNSEVNKPKEGSGLNKPAKVTLYNCKPKKASSSVDFLEKIKKYCKENDCEFISYSSSTGTWEFRVKHF